MDFNKLSRSSLPILSAPNVNQNHCKVFRSISEVATTISPKNSLSVNPGALVLRKSSSTTIACIPDRRVSIADVTPLRRKLPNKELSAGQSRNKSSSGQGKPRSSKLETANPGESTFFKNFYIKHAAKKIQSWKNIYLGDKYWLIEKVAFCGIICYLLYYIIHILNVLEDLRMQLDELQKTKEWWRWSALKVLDKIGPLEILLLLFAALMTRICMKGLDILHWRLELLQKLREEELKNSSNLKLKEMKLKSKTEIWKTLTDGLTKIVSTIVSAVVPTAAAEHILLKVFDMAETRQKDQSFKRRFKSKQKQGSNGDLIAEGPKTPLGSGPFRKQEPPVWRSSVNIYPHLKERILTNGNGSSASAASSASHSQKQQQTQMQPVHTGNGNSTGCRSTQNGGFHTSKSNAGAVLDSKRNSFKSKKSISNSDIDGRRPVFKN